MKIKKILEQDELFIISTDTVTGIGGTLNQNVKDKIKKVKKDHDRTYFAILVDSIKTARQFAEWSEEAEKIAIKYWPGALTIALDTYGLRMPNNRKLLRFLKKVGPIYLSSANIHGQKPLTFQKAIEAFGANTKVHLDFAKKQTGQSSTVIKAKTGEILRQGDVIIK